MLKTIFQILAIIGMIIICIMAFTIPTNPYEIIPAVSMMSFDKPLWFCIIFGGCFLYLMILWSIYDSLEQRKCAKKYVL